MFIHKNFILDWHTRIKLIKSVICILIATVVIISCSAKKEYVTATRHKLVKTKEKNYTTLVDGYAVATDSLFLDEKHFKNVLISKNKKQVLISTTDKTRLLSIADIQSRYKRGNVNLAVIIFRGGTFTNSSKALIQESVIGDTIRLTKEKIAAIPVLCNPPKGDIMILMSNSNP